MSPKSGGIKRSHKAFFWKKELKEQLGQEKPQLEQGSIFNEVASFNYFKIQKYYQNKPKFNDVYLKNNLPKIKDGP